MLRYDKNALKAEFVRNGLTVTDVGKLLGIARPTVYKRFNTGSWTLDEVKKLVELLHLSGKDLNRIFFA